MHFVSPSFIWDPGSESLAPARSYSTRQEGKKERDKMAAQWGSGMTSWSQVTKGHKAAKILPFIENGKGNFQITQKGRGDLMLRRLLP